MKLEALSSSKNVTTSDNATCFIVPLSFKTTLSAAAKVVEVADVAPSNSLSSAVVAVTPSRIFNSEAVEVTQSKMFNSALVSVAASSICISASVNAAKAADPPD